MADPATLTHVYGTTEPTTTSRRLVAGKLSLEIADGAVRNLCWNGVEVLRAVDYPVRNADWGTLSAKTMSEEVSETADGFDYKRIFTVGGGAIGGVFTCLGEGLGKVTASLDLRVQTPVRVNRAGFVILHPVSGFAGAPLVVTHRDGSVERGVFPRTVAAHQPAFDIVALRQEANGVSAEIAFAGEIFEMEDQRNWTDASYKTYCRPLSLPVPFDLAAHERVTQSVTLLVSGGRATQESNPEKPVTFGKGTGRSLPQLSLALEAGWEATAEQRPVIRASATLLRLDLTSANWAQTLPGLINSAFGALDLEVVVSDSASDLRAELALLAATGIIPRSILVLPKAWLKDQPTSGDGGDGASPAKATEVARAFFSQTEIGGGSLTNFTELNRNPASARTGDFISHGTCAIVHAADDLSVVQTLEALPLVFASAEALAPEKPYRLGLVSIGMRSNPYGSDVTPNPEGLRRPMAMIDPRQRGLFGAAWMVGAMAATQTFRIDRMSLAAANGPFGLFDGAQARPVFHVHTAFVRMENRQRFAASGPSGMAVVAVEGAMVIANLGPEPRSLELPSPMRGLILDRLQPTSNWLRTASRNLLSALNLPAFSVAFLLTDPGDIFGTDP